MFPRQEIWYWRRICQEWPQLTFRDINVLLPFEWLFCIPKICHCQSVPGFNFENSHLIISGFVWFWGFFWSVSVNNNKKKQRLLFPVQHALSISLSQAKILDRYKTDIQRWPVICLNSFVCASNSAENVDMHYIYVHKPCLHIGTSSTWEMGVCVCGEWLFFIVRCIQAWMSEGYWILSLAEHQDMYEIRECRNMPTIY